MRLRRFGAIDDVSRLRLWQIDLRGKTKQIGFARIRPFASDGQRLPSPWSIAKCEIVEGRKRPVSLGVHEEGEVLEVVVTIVQQDIEAGSQKKFMLRRIVAQECRGEAEKKRVFVSGNSEVGMEQTGRRVHVNAPPSADAVKPLGDKKASCLRFNKSVWSDIRTGFGRQLGVNIFKRSGTFAICTCVELHYPWGEIFPMMRKWRENFASVGVEKDVRLWPGATGTSRRPS